MGHDIIDKYTHWLFTDLDGTLIPLEGDQQHVFDLERLKAVLAERNIGLAFVTGRHRSSAISAIAEFNLPTPQWIISDVGTRISEFSEGQPVSSDVYRSHLQTITHGWDAKKLVDALAKISDRESMRLQEAEKLGEFKISFYAAVDCLDLLTETFRTEMRNLGAPYSIVSSVDPFTGDGLIDFLPTNVDKAFACRWLTDHLRVEFQRDITYAGDSGNDLAVLTSGCRAILVGNASGSVKQQVEFIDEVMISDKTATSAVLDGIESLHRDGDNTNRSAASSTTLAGRRCSGPRG